MPRHIYSVSGTGYKTGLLTRGGGGGQSLDVRLYPIYTRIHRIPSRVQGIQGIYKRVYQCIPIPHGSVNETPSLLSFFEQQHRVSQHSSTTVCHSHGTAWLLMHSAYTTNSLYNSCNIYLLVVERTQVSITPYSLQHEATWSRVVTCVALSLLGLTCVSAFARSRSRPIYEALRALYLQFFSSQVLVFNVYDILYYTSGYRKVTLCVVGRCIYNPCTSWYVVYTMVQNIQAVG